jgi:hypothetical protein
MFGKTQSEEAKKIQSEKKKRPIFFDGILYESGLAASKALNKPNSTVNYILNKKISENDPNYYFVKKSEENS